MLVTKAEWICLVLTVSAVCVCVLDSTFSQLPGEGYGVRLENEDLRSGRSGRSGRSAQLSRQRQGCMPDHLPVEPTVSALLTPLALHYYF